MTLPPLPEPGHRGPTGTGTYFDAFTADQLRDYARAAIAAHVPAVLAAVPAQPVAWLYQTKSGFRKCWHAGEQSYPAFIADMAAASEFPETHSWTPLYAAPQAVPVPAGWSVTYDGKRASYIYADQETAEFEAQQVGGTARAVAVYLAAAPKEQPHE